MRRIYPKTDVDPAGLTLVRIAHHLWLDRKRALREFDAQDVHSIDAALRTVGELQREVKQEAREHWKQRSKAA